MWHLPISMLSTLPLWQIPSYCVMSLNVESGKDAPGSSREPVLASADSGGHPVGLLGAELMDR